MKKIISVCLLAVALLLGGMTVESKTSKTKKKTKAKTSQRYAEPWTSEMKGYIGEHPVIVVIKLIDDVKIEGYYEFKSSNAPQQGKIKLSGKYKPDPVPDPEFPNYPWYLATLSAKNSSGVVIGKWDLLLDTRAGTIEGTCTINGKKYDVEAGENY